MPFRLLMVFVLSKSVAGPLRLRLNQLILDGRKRATAGTAARVVRENEELESEGELLALVDDDGGALRRCRGES